MSGKHALVASYSIPEPDRDSGGRRTLDLIDFLRDAGYTITFVPASPLTNPSASQHLKSRDISVVEGIVTRKAEIGPETVLRDILASRPVDLALLVFFPVAELFLPILRRVHPNARVIVDSVDLHCLRDARRRLSARNGRAQLLDAEFAARFISELNVYIAADGVLTVSEQEAAWIDNFSGGAARALYVPDCEELSPGTRLFADRRGMLALGSYHHPPNVDAIGFLCRRILPHVDARLLQEHPLNIVGSGLDEMVCEAAKNTANARLIGWVPSVTPYFDQARISVVPLRYGAGTKRKVIQSLLSGTPTVTTTIGAEGLDLVQERHALIADEPRHFAAAIERLLTDEDLWQRLAENGRSLMLATHARETARQRFFCALERTKQTPPRAELLPEITAKDYLRQANYDYLDRLLPQIDFHLIRQVPADARIAVLSDGEKRFLDLNGRQAWHFPQTEEGAPTIGAPHSASEILASLERLRQIGCNYLLVPFPQYWWLDHSPGFTAYLSRECQLIASKDEVGKLFALKASAHTGQGILRRANSPGTIESTRSKLSGRDRQVLFAYLVPLLSLLVCLIFSEIILRGSAPFIALRTEWVLKHPLARVPNKDLILIPPRFLDDSFYRTDPKRRTVIALGDSFTEGFPVSELNTFPAMVERLLFKKDIDVQVINAGIGDSGPDQHLRLLRQYLLPRLSPAILIWGLYANDIDDNLSKPVYQLSDGQLAPLDSRFHWIYIRQIVDQWMPFPRWLKDHSHIYRAFMKAFELFSDVPLPDQYKSNPRAWALEKLRLEIQTVKELAVARNLTVYLVLIAPQSVYLAKSDPERWSHHDHIQAHDALLAILKDEPTFIHAWFPLADPAEIFADENRDANAYGTRHYNEAGNKLFAELVVRRIVNDEQ